MRRQLLRPVLGGLTFAASVLGPRPAYARFLWAEMDPKSRPSLHLTFAEKIGEHTTSIPFEDIRISRVWDGEGQVLLTAPGDIPIASTVMSGTAATPAAQQLGGVLSQYGAEHGRFLLQYHAKAARSVEAAAQDANLPLELFVRREELQVIATLLHNGKPVPFGNVKLHAPNSDRPRDLITDANGEVRFKAPHPGLYGLGAAVAELKKGHYQDKPYDLIRHFSTLTFTISAELAPVAGIVPVALETTETADDSEKEPVKANPDKADPDAYALLEAAHNARQVMPPDFLGFDAQIIFQNGSQKATGTLRYRRGEDGILEVAGLSDEDKAWLEDQVLSSIAHRRGGDFSKGDGQHPLRFGTAPDNDFGKLIELGDVMQSSYRVRNNKVTEVTRTAGTTRFTISVLETREADAGKYLPLHFIVAYRDQHTGALQKVEGFRDAYARVGNVWLPTSRIVVTFDTNNSPRSRRIQLRNIKLPKPP